MTHPNMLPSAPQVVTVKPDNPRDLLPQPGVLSQHPSALRAIDVGVVVMPFLPGAGFVVLEAVQRREYHHDRRHTRPHAELHRVDRERTRNQRLRGNIRTGNIAPQHNFSDSVPIGIRSRLKDIDPVVDDVVDYHDRPHVGHPDSRRPASDSDVQTERLDHAIQEAGRRVTPAGLYPVVQRFYRKFAPERIEGVGDLLVKYNDNLHSLVEALEVKYQCPGTIDILRKQVSEDVERWYVRGDSAERIGYRLGLWPLPAFAAPIRQNNGQGPDHDGHWHDRDNTADDADDPRAHWYFPKDPTDHPPEEEAPDERGDYVLHGAEDDSGASSSWLEPIWDRVRPCDLMGMDVVAPSTYPATAARALFERTGIDFRHRLHSLRPMGGDAYPISSQNQRPNKHLVDMPPAFRVFVAPLSQADFVPIGGLSSGDRPTQHAAVVPPTLGLRGRHASSTDTFNLRLQLVPSIHSGWDFVRESKGLEQHLPPFFRWVVSRLQE